MKDNSGVGLQEQSSAQLGLFWWSSIDGPTSRNLHSFAVPQFPHQQDGVFPAFLGYHFSGLSAKPAGGNLGVHIWPADGHLPSISKTPPHEQHELSRHDDLLRNTPLSAVNATSCLRYHLDFKVSPEFGSVTS